MIHFEIEDGKLTNVEYTGGCNGNLQGISKLVEGMDVVDTIAAVERDSSDKPLEDVTINSIDIEQI